MKQIILFFALLTGVVFAQEPSKILLTGGNLHIGNGEVFNSAAIGIEDGKITFIKNTYALTIDPNDWDTIIDITGKEVYPGFVAPNSTLGLTEIDAVKATRDFDEVGTYNPHIRAQIAFNVESKVLSTVRSNGVLLAQATPRGGIVSGSSSIMTTSGWNWEDATVLKDDGIHLNWPSSMEGGGWWAEPSAKKKNEKYAENKQAISDFFQMAKAYLQEKNPEKKDLRLAIDIRLRAQARIFRSGFCLNIDFSSREARSGGRAWCRRPGHRWWDRTTRFAWGSLVSALRARS